VFAVVLGVFVYTKLSEGLEVDFVLSDLTEEVERLFDEVRANDLQNLVLLEGLTRDVKAELPMPLTKLRYSGMRSSHSSMMKTRRACYSAFLDSSRTKRDRFKLGMALNFS